MNTDLSCRRIGDGRLAAACLILGLVLQACGCTSAERLRGDGYSPSENWGQELREQHSSAVQQGGVSTKAQQIERNLGVR